MVSIDRKDKISKEGGREGGRGLGEGEKGIR